MHQLMWSSLVGLQVSDRLVPFNMMKNMVSKWIVAQCPKHSYWRSTFYLFWCLKSIISLIIWSLAPDLHDQASTSKLWNVVWPRSPPEKEHALVTKSAPLKTTKHSLSPKDTTQCMRKYQLLMDQLRHLTTMPCLKAWC